jgi:hypothetical protein
MKWLDGQLTTSDEPTIASRTSELFEFGSEPEEPECEGFELFKGLTILLD